MVWCSTYFFNKMNQCNDFFLSLFLVFVVVNTEIRFQLVIPVLHYSTVISSNINYETIPMVENKISSQLLG